jgi:PAS domain-containing protein
LTRPSAAFAHRYGLAVASVAGALLLDLLFRHFNLPHSVCCICTVRNRNHLLVRRTKPGIVAVLLASLIRGFIVEGETSSLSHVLYDLVFLTFATLMIWVRRGREAVEVRIADRTAKLTAANDDLLRQKEQLDELFDLSPEAAILTDDDFRVCGLTRNSRESSGTQEKRLSGTRI